MIGGRLLNGLLRPFNVRLVSSIKPSRHPDAPDITHCRVLPAATYSPWLDDAAFLSLYGRVRANTLVDIYRCYELWGIAKQLGTVPGDFLEVGVWRGGTGAILATAGHALNRTVYLADTFAGVVKVGANDPEYAGGEHADTSEETVRRLMRELSLTNVEMLVGVFPEETASRVPGPIALLHCDVDVYESSRDIIEWALPRLASNGVVVFDDYGFRGTEGVTRFVNALRAREDLFFIHNLNGHAIFVKRAPPPAG
jgi:O-methyltransferase